MSRTHDKAAEHQAALNEYLHSHKINELFIQLVESLLIEKPDNPIRFIIEVLQKKDAQRSDEPRRGTTAGDEDADQPRGLPM
mmetsp:Transcript_29249/g.89512  ORF Transcript_29249/g.89512 Transcript_29249/m.89512 type:complete len:82 (-) Transcript_29249:2118-2363(-)